MRLSQEDMARLHRLATLAVELYGDDWLAGLSRDLGVPQRTVKGWKSGRTPVPDDAIEALSAKALAAKAWLAYQEARFAEILSVPI